MDLLYSRYASPLDLINLYIRRGRFGEFVTSVLNADYERRKEDAEKDEDWKLWFVYIQSGENVSFMDWKNRVLGTADTNNNAGNFDGDLTAEKIQSMFDKMFSEG